jgi:hypothetical protein
MQNMIASSFGDWATAVGAGATVALVLATIGLLLAAIWAGITAARGVRAAAAGVDEQIEEQRRTELKCRVYDHLSTYSSRDFTESTIGTVPLLKAFESGDADGADHWQGMTDTDRARALTVLNFYELVATEYNAMFLDRDIANRSVAYAAIVIWERAAKLVAWLRKDDKAYFAQWERLYLDHSLDIIEAERKSREAPSDNAARVDAPPGITDPAPPVGEEIHLPGPTILPLLNAIGITLIVIGTTITILLSIVGAIIFVVTTAKWIADTRRDVEALPIKRD